MKSDRPYPMFMVTAKGARWLQTGHPWVYANDLQDEAPSSAPSLTEDLPANTPAPLSSSPDAPGLENGNLVDVFSPKGSYLGTGFYSAASKIRIRLLSRNANDRFDEAFWQRRFQYAWDYRQQVLPYDLKAIRLIFGEADQLPGLTVDRFQDVLVAQCLSYGMEKRKAMLYPLLLEVLRANGQEISGIYERNDDPLREKEGLEQGTGWFVAGEQREGPGGQFDPQTSQDNEQTTRHGERTTRHSEQTTRVIEENGLSFLVDFAQGQKTGYFLDQKLNRRRVQDLAHGKRVLDCFTHTGSFALNACRGGALSVDGLDISAKALATAQENARLNQLENKVSWIQADAFEFLTQKVAEKVHPWDFIILDPPAFTKSRTTVGKASHGYYEINRLAMQLLPRGGYLATCSCSHFMTADRLLQELGRAAQALHVSLKQIEARQQSPDHPILRQVPETEYLKFYLFQIV